MQRTPPIVNKFIKGVNTDISEDLLEDGFLTAGHNIKLTDNDGKQGVSQKVEGYIKRLNGYRDTLKPLAAREFNDVIYIVSYDLTVDNGTIEYGTYPSADLLTLNETTELCTKVPVYAPLPNYKFIPLVYANPDGFFNIDTLNPAPLQSILTTNDGSAWVLESVSSGVTASPASGNNGSAITIAIPSNYTDTILNHSIRVKSALTADAPIRTINIQQNNDPWTLATPDTFSVPWDSGALTFLSTITSNGAWEHITHSYGVNILVASGVSGGELKFSVNENSNLNRTLTITIRNVLGDSSADEIITINQANHPISEDLPTVSITSASILGATITTNNDVSDGGTSAVTERGICWSLSTDPTTADSKILSGTGTGAYTIVINSLTANTAYNFRAYAVNTTGTAYSSNVELTTAVNPTGSYSTNRLEGNDAIHALVDVTYDSKGLGTGWSSEKVAGSGDAVADLIPAIGTSTTLMINVLFTGAAGDVATYELKDTVTGIVLDTVDVLIITII